MECQDDFEKTAESPATLELMADLEGQPQRQRQEQHQITITLSNHCQGSKGEDGGEGGPPRGRRPFLLFLFLLFTFLVAFPKAHSSCRGWLKETTASATPGATAAAAAAVAMGHEAEALPPQLAVSVRIPPSEDRLPGTGRGMMSRVASGVRGLVQRRQVGGIPPPPPQLPVLECFQVAQPVLRPTPEAVDRGLARPAGENCTVLLMDHVFGWSYGKPFVGNYVPPNCDFNRVVMNFSVVSEGRQFDRLAIMYMNDTEVWRTSTAEPVRPPGIHWEYFKDMTPYLSFWKQPQKIIFDLGNLIDDKYTGSFNTTLTATFFKSNVQTSMGSSPPADLIIPISRRASGSEPPVSQFTVPEHEARDTVADFPRNANRAVLSVSANGQAEEEFWWANVLESDVYSFNDTAGEYPGLSPFREVHALVDGQLAGVQWPFPVIFTGGIVPSFHRPVVGLQAFDLREHEIDITPWLPLLCDGNPHTFSFRVSGLHDDGGDTPAGKLTDGVNPNWYITGKIFVWLDDEGSITTGTAPEVHGLEPSIQLTRALSVDAQGRNQSLSFSVGVQRELTLKATVKTQKTSGEVVWRQKLSYVNRSNLTTYGMDQTTDFDITGSDTTTLGSGSGSAVTVHYAADYGYPISVSMATRLGPAGMSLQARLYQGLSLQTAGRGGAVFPTGLEAFADAAADEGRYSASALTTYRDGVATWQQSPDGRTSTGTGSTTQEFAFGGNFERYPVDHGGDVAATAAWAEPDEMLYFRNVSAVNDAVVSDRERVQGGGRGGGAAASVADAAAAADFVLAPEQVVLTPPRLGEFAPLGVGRGLPGGAGARRIFGGGFGVGAFEAAARTAAIMEAQESQ